MLNRTRLIIVGVILAVLFFIKFPTLYNALNTPTGYWFPKQTSWFDAWDINFQVAYIRFGQRNGVLLENTYTTIPHQPVFIYQYYTILGVINRLIHLDPFLLFHISSIITSVILILVYWWMIKIFLKGTLYQIAALIMIVLGGGAGWLPLPWKSVDTHLAGFTSWYAFERGHEAAITLLLLSCFGLLWQYLKTKKKRYLYWLLLTSALSTSFHPPFVALLFIAGSIVAFWQFRKSGNSDLFYYPIFLVTFFALYFLLVFSKLIGNPGFSGVVGQELFNIDTLALLSGFGLMGFFIAWQLIFAEDRGEECIYIKVLFFTQLFLLLTPFGFHLYFAKNLFAWGVIIGFWGIKDFTRSKKRQIQIIICLVIFSLISRIDIFNQLLHVNKDNSFFFLKKQEADALTFISKLPADKGILSLYRIGNYIPAFSDLRVYYGHNFQTPNSTDKKKQAQEFYRSNDKEKQKQFLQQNNIEFIYYGLEEANLREQNKLPISNPFADYPAIYHSDSVIIYQVPPISGKGK